MWPTGMITSDMLVGVMGFGVLVKVRIGYASAFDVSRAGAGVVDFLMETLFRSDFNTACRLRFPAYVV